MKTQTAKKVKAKKVTFTETQKTIYKQLSENTGKALCDSGDAYGRNYDKYKGIEKLNFNEGLRIDEYGAIIPIQVYMNNCLTVTQASKQLQKDILKHLEKTKAEHTELSYYMQEEIAEFLKGLGATETIYGGKFDNWSNTYNGENNLSQDLQFCYFELNGTDYAIIETHNGCDIRGGYSSGVCYEITALDGFCDLSVSLEIETDNGHIEDYSGTCNDYQWSEVNKRMEDTETGKEIRYYNPCIM